MPHPMVGETMTELDSEIKEIEARLDALKREQKQRNESAILQTINSLGHEDGLMNELVTASQNVKIRSIQCPAFSRSGNSCRGSINIICEDSKGRVFGLSVSGELEGKKIFSSHLIPSFGANLFEKKSENDLFVALVKYRLLKILRLAVVEMGKMALTDPAKNSELMRIKMVLDARDGV